MKWDILQGTITYPTPTYNRKKKLSTQSAGWEGICYLQGGYVYQLTSFLPESLSSEFWANVWSFRIHPWKPTWHWKIPIFNIGNTSSNVGFSIANFVFRGCTSKSPVEILMFTWRSDQPWPPTDRPMLTCEEKGAAVADVLVINWMPFILQWSQDGPLLVFSWSPEPL